MLLEFELSVCEQKSGDAHPSVVSNYLEEVIEREQRGPTAEDVSLITDVSHQLLGGALQRSILR